MQAANRRSSRPDLVLPELPADEAESVWQRLKESSEERKIMSDRLEIVEKRVDRLADSVESLESTSKENHREVLLAIAEHKAITADRFASLAMKTGAGIGGGAVIGGGTLLALWPHVQPLAAAVWRMLFG